jgi:hypothetical protein
MGQLEDSSWDVRQQAIQTLEKFSEQRLLTVHLLSLFFSHFCPAVFQETLKTEGSVAKLAAKLEDSDEDVRAAAAHALLTLSSKGLSYSVTALSLSHLSQTLLRRGWSLTRSLLNSLLNSRTTTTQLVV